jgi:hypothetical protein
MVPDHYTINTNEKHQYTIDWVVFILFSLSLFE